MTEFVRHFGMAVDQTPETCLARVLPAPTLNYGPGSIYKQIVACTACTSVQILTIK